MIDETDDALALLQIDDDSDLRVRATVVCPVVVIRGRDVAWATVGTPTSVTAHATPRSRARDRSDRKSEWV
jgi:hypothetical protein